MYFWKIRNLRDDLVAGPLPEAESFKYLLAYSVLEGILWFPLFEANIYDVYLGIIGAVFSIVGLFYIYQCNGGADGENFLQRYLSLGWVVAVRLSLLLVPITIVYLVALEMISEVPEQTTLLEVLFCSLFLVLFFWRLGVHFKWINSEVGQAVFSDA